MVIDELKTLLVDEYDCDPRDVTPDASFRGTMKFDSLEIADLILNMEEKFAVEISDDDAQKLYTVKDAVAYIEHTRSSGA
jgi:acyl carrier protein